MRSRLVGCALLAACNHHLIRADYGAGNSGVNYRAEPEHVALAAADGEVVHTTGTSPGHICVLLVHHPPQQPQHQFFTAYCFLDSAVVQRGRTVLRGEMLGTADWMVRLQLCTYPCATAVWDDFEGTRNPERHMAGCYEPRRTYDPATLTRPVPCRN